MLANRLLKSIWLLSSALGFAQIAQAAPGPRVPQITFHGVADPSVHMRFSVEFEPHGLFCGHVVVWDGIGVIPDGHNLNGEVDPDANGNYSVSIPLSAKPSSRCRWTFKGISIHLRGRNEPPKNPKLVGQVFSLLKYNNQPQNPYWTDGPQNLSCTKVPGGYPGLTDYSCKNTNSGEITIPMGVDKGQQPKYDIDLEVNLALRPGQPAAPAESQSERYEKLPQAESAITSLAPAAPDLGQAAR